MHVKFAQTTNLPIVINPATWAPIPGLVLQLPAASADEDTATITLNVPNPYVLGQDFAGFEFGIGIQPAPTPIGPTASFSYELSDPPSHARVPTTLVVSIPLRSTAQTIWPVGRSVRGSTLVIDSPASLSAILGHS